eukprot:15245319-Heterocapsa_arctica.AAC.1
MTVEQTIRIRAWVQTFKENEPANTIRVQDDTLLRTSESEHTELEKNIHKQCYDALINGYHGNNQETNTPGYMFDVVENS